MAPTKRPRGHNTEEVGDLNPLNNNEIPHPEHLILKVTLSTSSHTLSLSHPDPRFRLIADIKIFHSPYPNSDVTISTGRPRGLDPTEVGDLNPLDDTEVAEPECVVLKVTLSTSAPTLSLSRPDPLFRLLADVEIFHSPRPGCAVTLSIGRSALDDDMAFVLGAFHLVGLPGPVPPGPMLLTQKFYPHYRCRSPINKDLLRDPDFGWTKFVTVPAAGSTRVEVTMPLEEILRNSPEANIGDLKAGMRYGVWMKQDMLLRIGDYFYWGDMAGELKGKKLSSLQAVEGFQAVGDSAGFLAEVIAGDGWALQRPVRLYVRGNVGKFGPVFEFVE
ncbi:hypothetical protein C8R46DRAFT_1350780 [Mycena filopes]|nr:hypothetical protein C8R46DRAFT_1350780 [Mycena filopes]